MSTAAPGRASSDAVTWFPLEVLACTGKEFAGAWGQLEWGVRTGGDIWRRGNPGEATSFWHMIRLDPRKEDIFSRAMTGTENFSTPFPFLSPQPHMAEQMS
jgi:hypothetical protein